MAEKETGLSAKEHLAKALVAIFEHSEGYARHDDSIMEMMRELAEEASHHFVEAFGQLTTDLPRLSLKRLAPGQEVTAMEPVPGSLATPEGQVKYFTDLAKREAAERGEPQRGKKPPPPPPPPSPQETPVIPGNEKLRAAGDIAKEALMKALKDAYIRIGYSAVPFQVPENIEVERDDARRGLWVWARFCIDWGHAVE